MGPAERASRGPKVRSAYNTPMDQQEEGLAGHRKHSRQDLGDTYTRPDKGLHCLSPRHWCHQPFW